MDHPTEFGIKDLPEPVIFTTNLSEQYQRVTEICVVYHYDSLWFP